MCEGLAEQPETPTTDDSIRTNYEMLIAQLRLSAEPTVKLDAENFAKFMVGNGTACVC